jgi:hypothetical protein
MLVSIARARGLGSQMGISNPALEWLGGWHIKPREIPAVARTRELFWRCEAMPEESSVPSAIKLTIDRSR